MRLRKILEVSHQTNAKAFQNIKDVLVDAYDKIELCIIKRVKLLGYQLGLLN